ncbi:hypothetical protein C8Q70DRAFT_471683 [Cubamyces menziesii]|uniref:Uncharacterized protein n=1 Tax=Trametes cubensis TaxID=1111947 RepID=A0AAD7X8F9_9APHY|nr:hypothetical protein C8Q70DRAFT_471683 [Cubamyces menziesii]KAJ8480928.1 hypothetical protein ONZ51_g6349 [Trametes cubensis]
MCTDRLLWALYSLLLVGTAFAKHGKDGDGDDDDTNENDDAVQSTDGNAALATTTVTSSAIPSGAAASSTSLHFLQPANATTCGSLTFRWDSTSSSAPLTLIVTNDRAVVNNTQGGPGSANDATLVSRTLSTNVLASAAQYAWSPVDIPQGLYVAVAFDTSRSLGILAQSPPFSVLPSGNTTCLASSSSGNATMTTSVDSSSASSPGPTSSAASDGPKMLSPAALGGTVAGVTVAIILLVLAFTFPHFWRRSPTRRPRGSRPGGPYYLF